MTWLLIAALAGLLLLAGFGIALVVRSERRTKQGFRDMTSIWDARIEKEKAAEMARAEELTRRLSREPVVTSIGVNFDMDMGRPADMAGAE